MERHYALAPEIYPPEEAKHVFEVIKGFMKKLATRVDENGDPEASGA